MGSRMSKMLMQYIDAGTRLEMVALGHSVYMVHLASYEMMAYSHHLAKLARQCLSQESVKVDILAKDVITTMRNGKGVYRDTFVDAIDTPFFPIFFTNDLGSEEIRQRIEARLTWYQENREVGELKHDLGWAVYMRLKEYDDINHFHAVQPDLLAELKQYPIDEAQRALLLGHG